ncbi:cyclin-O isoform X2 [Boleophthalmus pectinirostris]|uniref:cyclin-O isoform X2 n=1 Tax=Boleophthalmus pectinirostris TaxID=150288 RepID=UPI00242C6D0B|nr:cyclin-O isoform X2 [Boleophthalmus pectinirostris]
MVSFLPSDAQNVHKRRWADRTSPLAHTSRHRKQKFTCKLSDSGFEDELLLSPVPSPDQTKLLPLRAESQSGQLSWYRQYGDTGYRIQKERETHFHPCKSLARQPQLNAEARCKLVSWLIPVHQHLSLSFECCCLTINIMDRFLASTPVAADCFQLLGVTALLLASKQVEVCSPKISDLLSLCCDAFTKEQLYCYNFKSGEAATALNKNDKTRTSRCSKLAQKLCELSLADYAFNKYSASLTARCALQLATETAQATQEPLHLQGKEWESFLNKSDSSSTDSNYSNSSLSGDLVKIKEYSLIQECTNNLRLLASLNQEALTML